MKIASLLLIFIFSFVATAQTFCIDCNYTEDCHASRDMGHEHNDIADSDHHSHQESEHDKDSSENSHSNGQCHATCFHATNLIYFSEVPLFKIVSYLVNHNYKDIRSIVSQFKVEFLRPPIA